MDSEIYRERLDKTDEQILQLFAERMKLSAELSENANEKYMTVTERKKERQKLMNAAEKSPEEIRDYATVLYSLIFDHLIFDIRHGSLENGPSLVQYTDVGTDLGQISQYM